MKNKGSFFTLIILFLFICGMRYVTLNDNLLSWDVFGYYLYLPATFIHHDPMLTDVSWIMQVMKERPISGTLYQLTNAPDGSYMYFFFMGSAILMSPFFFIGHLIALSSGSTADGFSLPYQYTITIGFLLYTLIGLVFLRKILAEFFKDTIIAIILVIIVLGTNYLAFTGQDNLMTATPLFMLLSIIVWNTIQWHKYYKLKNLLFAGICTALCLLVKPSEAIVVMIPVLWGVYDKQTFTERIKLMWEKRKQIILASIAAFLILSPQMIYWKMATGRFLYDSYKNPAVGLDFFSPHVFSVLFSFKKGWLIYTPIMYFALFGFYYLYKNKREIFFAVTIYFLISFWIVSSWTEWWYGASFSIRPLITTYVLLSIPLGFTLEKILQLKPFKKMFLGTVILFFISLNLFQLWQLDHWILDPYRTTRAYYFAILGKTSNDDETRNLLSVDRSFDGNDVFKNETNYTMRNIGNYDFSTPDSNLLDHYIFDTISKSTVFRLDSNVTFSHNILTTYLGITKKDHAWLRASVDVFIPEGYTEELPCLILTFNRKEGNYNYRSTCLDGSELKPNKWNTIKFDYLTPNIRSVNDFFQSYVWHRGKKPIYIDNFKINVFEYKW